MLKCIVMFARNIENLKILKYPTVFKNTLSLFIFYSKCDHEYKNIFKE